MKIPIMNYVALITLLFVTTTIAVIMNMPLNWVFYLTCVGQVFVGVMVCKVLTDNYTTDKKFDGFYEDHPIEPYGNYK